MEMFAKHMEHQSDLLGEEIERSRKELLCVLQEDTGKAATQTGAPRIRRSRSYDERLNFDSEISSVSETVRWLCTELEENVRRLYMKIGPPSVVNSDVKLVSEHIKNLFELLRVFTLGQDLNKLEMEQQVEEMNLEQMRNLTMTFHCHELQTTFRKREMNCLDEDEDEDDAADDDEEEEEEIDENYYQSAMEKEVEAFAEYRTGWESSWSGRFGRFQDTTELSPMIFTHRTPGVCLPNAVDGSTLQIYSIKVAKVKNAPWLKWPLQVYGLVAVRDNVDHNRNFIFLRERDDCQILTEEDRSLQLTGPSRAIVFGRSVRFEVQLKLKGKTESEDRLLMSGVFYDHSQHDHRLHTYIWRKHFCTIEVSFRQLQETVQATILGVRVVEGTPWPFKYGGRVTCSTPPQEIMVIHEDGTVMDITDPPSKQVVLLDSRGEEMPTGSDGYLDLSRKVVSVELRERHVVSHELQASLKVAVQAYSPAYPDIAARGHAYITPKRCNISQALCDLGDSKVEITVAWSLLVDDKDFMMMGRYV